MKHPKDITQESLDYIRAHFTYKDGYIYSAGQGKSWKPSLPHNKRLKGCNVKIPTYGCINLRRIVWFLCKGEWPCYAVRCINRDPDDIRIENLAATKYMTYKKKHNATSKYKGVCWSYGYWNISVCHEGKQYLVTKLICEEEAALAYNKKCKELGVDESLWNVLS